MMKSVDVVFDQARFMQFEIAKMGLILFLTIVGVVPLVAIQVIVYRTFGIYLRVIVHLTLLLLAMIVLIAVDLCFDKKRAHEVNIDFDKSIKASWLLIRSMVVNVDSSSYNVSADHQRQVKQNILRLASFVVVDRKQTAAIYIAESLRADTVRDLELLNHVAYDIAQYLKLRNSSFQQQMWQVKRFGIGHTEKYSTQLLYY